MDQWVRNWKWKYIVLASAWRAGQVAWGRCNPTGNYGCPRFRNHHYSSKNNLKPSAILNLSIFTFSVQKIQRCYLWKTLHSSISFGCYVDLLDVNELNLNDYLKCNQTITSITQIEIKPWHFPKHHLILFWINFLKYVKLIEWEKYHWKEPLLTCEPLFSKYKIHIFSQQFISWGPPPGMENLARKLIPKWDVPAEPLPYDTQDYLGKTPSNKWY